MYITLNYRRTLYTKVVYINYLTNSLNIYIGKTLVPNSSTLFSHPSTDRKLYYSSSLSLNKSINPTSISL
jgi:hypothetical protein